MLEATRLIVPDARFYQATSSEIFGEPIEAPQSEMTPLAPISPYGVAKAYAHFLVQSYRKTHGLYACSGILYNHESPRRPLDFVPRKVAHAAARISLGLDFDLHLGSLEARRDWGYAGDYVRAMWLMLQQSEADDYVIATGVSHSVADLVETAFRHVGLDSTTTSVQTPLSSEASRSCTTWLETQRRHMASSTGSQPLTSKSSYTCSSTPTWSASGARSKRLRQRDLASPQRGQPPERTRSCSP